jgi:DNA-binding protein HU-beta
MMIFGVSSLKLEFIKKVMIIFLRRQYLFLLENGAEFEPDYHVRRYVMNKADLITRVSEIAEISKKDSTAAVDEILDSIKEALKAGDKIQLIGFGNFEVRERAARKGRNPQTGEEIEIAASKMPAFSPGKGLREAIK